MYIYRDLEHYFGTDLTSAILQEGTDSCHHPHKIKEDISSKDRDLLLAKHEGRADMSIMVEMESDIGWPQLWDLVLDNSARCIEGLRNLLWMITFPCHACLPCMLAPYVREMTSAETPCSAMSSTLTPTATSAAKNSSKSFHLSQMLTQSFSTNFTKLFQT